MSESWVDDVYENYCLCPSDFYYLDCKIGDEGYFGNTAEEVDKNRENDNLQKLDNYIAYDFNPYVSNNKQYKMFYILKRNNRSKR